MWQGDVLGSGVAGDAGSVTRLWITAGHGDFTIDFSALVWMCTAHPPVPVLNSAGSVTSSGNPVLSCGLKFSEIRPGLQELKSGMCNVMQLASLIIVGAISRMHNYLNCRQNNH